MKEIGAVEAVIVPIKGVIEYMVTRGLGFDPILRFSPTKGSLADRCRYHLMVMDRKICEGDVTMRRMSWEEWEERSTLRLSFMRTQSIPEVIIPAGFTGDIK